LNSSRLFALLRWPALALALWTPVALSACAAAIPPGQRSAVASLTRGLQTRRVPRATSPEYLRSWGVRAVGADAAYRAGVTGRGVTIALIDTGVPAGAHDLAVSRSSVDLIERRTPGAVKHGRSVAGPLTAMLNGQGTIGLAYDSTLLSVRADMDGACLTECAFRASDVARGIDYALARKARIIVLALVSPKAERKLTPEFEAALGRAVDAGALVMIAGGNNGAPDPVWPARYAAEPRYQGQVIAVGATGQDGALTPWSNRAGAAKSAYIVAPGVDIVTDCDPLYCYLRSGTSFSVPYVAGAAALLMDAFPRLGGREIAALLLDHARDLGEPGVDPIYGRGGLDVAAALKAGRGPNARITG
jgi:subtilisin family serine protease